jgi:hypothetical protein
MTDIEIAGLQVPPSADDLSAAYQDHRVNLAQASAASRLEARVRSRAPVITPEPGTKAAKTAQTAGATALGAAKDVALGVVEAPLQALGGAEDAVNEASDTAFSVAGWLNDNVVDLGSVSIFEKPEGDATEIIPGALYWKSGMPEKNQLKIPEGAIPDEAESTTGGVVRGISQFLTGFAVGGKALKGIEATGQAAKIGKAAVQGMISDAAFFDAMDGRLADLIQEFPALQNPVTEYLATDKNDSEGEAKFKRALDGLVPGLAADGLVAAVRSIKSWKGGAKPVPQDMAAKTVEDDAFKVLGEPANENVIEVRPSGPVVSEVAVPGVATPAGEAASPGAGKLATATEATDLPVPADVAAKGVASADGEAKEVFINWARIDTPEDVKAVMQDAADAFKPGIDEARRGVRTWQETKLSAGHVDAWDTLSARRQGAPLNAEESLAARELWVRSSNKLAEVARLAAETPSDANVFAFRKMMAVHHAIQTEVLAARTETARALNAWKIPAGEGTLIRGRQVEDMLNSAGGPEVAQEMARRITALAEAGYIREMDTLAEKGVWATSRDALVEAWIMSLLSGPKTHIVNTMSNTATLFQQMYERQTAAMISNVLGTDGGVVAGEAGAQFFGLVEGFKDGLRYAWKAFKTGQTGYGMQKIDTPRAKAISSEAFGMANDNFAGRAVDLIGEVIRIPGRALGAEDEFFKTVGYRMELKAQALRMASGEVASGKIKPEGLKSRIADIVENPPQNIKLSAIDQATYQTFTSAPGDFAKSVSKLVNRFPALRVIVPFVNTPANLVKYSFERTPLAPLMKHVQADLKAGGARADLAKARMATGTMMLLAAADLAMGGTISGNGPKDRRETSTMKREGWQAYSVKTGDRWFSYQRTDPLGMSLGLAADMVEILANSDDPNGEESQAMVAAIAAAMGNAVTSKTYLSGMAEFFEAMGDPTRYAEGFFQRLAGSVVPTGVAEVARAVDPVAREPESDVSGESALFREVMFMVDAMRRRTPGLSKDMPARRDLWGREISYASGMGTAYDVFSPIYSKAESKTPVDTELLRLGYFPSMPQRKTSFNGVSINLERYPSAYSRLVELAGNELKESAYGAPVDVSGKGLMDALNDLVKGDHPLSDVYRMRSDGPDGGKAMMIQKMILKYRDAAKDVILQEFPEIRAEYEQARSERMAVR